MYLVDPELCELFLVYSLILSMPESFECSRSVHPMFNLMRVFSGEVFTGFHVPTNKKCASRLNRYQVSAIPCPITYIHMVPVPSPLILGDAEARPVNTTSRAPMASLISYGEHSVLNRLGRRSPKVGEASAAGMRHREVIKILKPVKKKKIKLLDVKSSKERKAKTLFEASVLSCLAGQLTDPFLKQRLRLKQGARLRSCRMQRACTKQNQF